MKQVEYFSFTLPPNIWSKKPYPSRFKMSVEEAAKRYPGALPILGSREVRHVPTTPQELALHSKIQGY